MVGGGKEKEREIKLSKGRIKYKYRYGRVQRWLSNRVTHTQCKRRVGGKRRKEKVKTKYKSIKSE